MGRVIPILKFCFAILATVLATSVIQAQNEFDALRYSTQEFTGDARFNAMGGSFGALGANMSALSVNPGGIGVYKSSDFSFTPSFHFNHSKSDVDGYSESTGKLNFHLSNIGFVKHFEGKGRFKSSGFALGYNRLSNYNKRIATTSITDNSFLTTYTNELNEGDGTVEGDIEFLYPFSSNLAYQNYLVNPLSSNPNYYNHVFGGTDSIIQKTTYNIRGGSGEYYLTYGGNFMDRFYVGATLGFPVVRHEYERTYEEQSDLNDTVVDFTSFTVQDYVKTSGTGANLKVGAIYRAYDWLRFGLAVHTPTFYALQDEYSTTLTAVPKDTTQFNYESPFGQYSYNVVTPFRWLASVAVVAGNRGVINVDYERVNYTTMSLRASNDFIDGYDFSAENQRIDDNFRSAYHLRIGTEWRIDPLRLRAGFRMNDATLSSDVSGSNASQWYSLGIGLKEKKYYFDASYALKRYQMEQTAIIEAFSDYASTRLTDHYVSFTLGFRF